MEAAIARHGKFELLNRDSLGWEVVVDLPLGDPGATGPPTQLAVAFIEHCWRRIRDGHELPLISIVPQYHVDHDSRRSRIAFLFYPMREAVPALRDAAVSAVARELEWFNAERGQTDRSRVERWEEPIR
jgi:hypothetical protein